jgi:hypothetical protein
MMYQGQTHKIQHPFTHPTANSCIAVAQPQNANTLVVSVVAPVVSAVVVSLLAIVIVASIVVA